MGQPDPTSNGGRLNRTLADADEAVRLYQLLATQISPGQGEGGRRPQPTSRPPLQIDPVSLMGEFEQYFPSFIGRARWLLDPWKRIDITGRTGARCPYCQSSLVGWLRPKADQPGYITCDPGHLETLGPNHWVEADWPRLGVMAGVHIDARYGPRLELAELA